MNPLQIEDIMNRLHGMWPKMANDNTDREWLRFMRTLDFKTADNAVDELRDTLGWPPSIADFRAAYRLATEHSGGNRVQLPGGKQLESYKDVYGYSEKNWVYCWKCDMAIPVDDQYLYEPDRGMFHPKPCPGHGMAPLMPAAERMERRERFAKKGLS